MDMKALFNITYGMYVVCTELEGRLNGQVANAVMQITSEPVCVSTCLHKANLTTEMIAKSGRFSVSILERDVPMIFLGKFGFKSGRNIDKFADTKYRLADSGDPIVEDWSVAAFDAKVICTVDLPSHVLFIGEVTQSMFFKDAPLLTYHDYHTIKRGKSPKTAPTFGFNKVK